MSRFLANLTWQEVQALDKDKGVVVLPIGAIEQHGPHMPLGTDTSITNSVVREAFLELDNDVAAWCLPTLPYGKSNEHWTFPGTITLSTQTLIKVVTDIAHSLLWADFRRILFFTGHGGNKALLEMVARDIRTETGLMTFVAMPQPMTPEERAELPELEQKYGIHAGLYETSVMLATAPNTVRMERATAHYPDFPGKNVGLTSMNERGPVMAWQTRDWSPLGHFGDPTQATAELGQKWIRQAGERLAELIAEIAVMEVAF